MTNLEKFIEVMNETFHARFTKENMKLRCCPCGALKIARYACDRFKCEGCYRWWGKEYKPRGREKQMEVKPIPYPTKSYKAWHEFILKDLDGLIEEGWALAHIDEPESRLVFKKSVAKRGALALANIVSYLEAIGIGEELRKEAQENISKQFREGGQAHGQQKSD